MQGANALLKLLPARALPSCLAHRHARITEPQVTPILCQMFRLFERETYWRLVHRCIR